MRKKLGRRNSDLNPVSTKQQWQGLVTPILLIARDDTENIPTLGTYMDL